MSIRRIRVSRGNGDKERSEGERRLGSTHETYFRGMPHTVGTAFGASWTTPSSSFSYASSFARLILSWSE